jgi:hypothetical protein
MRSIEVYSYSNVMFPFWIPVSYVFTISDVRDMISSYFQSLYEGSITLLDKDGCIIEIIDEKDSLFMYPVDRLYID